MPFFVEILKMNGKKKAWGVYAKKKVENIIFFLDFCLFCMNFEIERAFSAFFFAFLPFLHKKGRMGVLFLINTNFLIILFSSKNPCFLLCFFNKRYCNYL